MHCKDYEDFAKQNNIVTTEVDGEFGSGYACAYVYFEPESVIKCLMGKDGEIEYLKTTVAILRSRIEGAVWARKRMTLSKESIVLPTMEAEAARRYPDKRCGTCKWWDDTPWELNPETRVCFYPDETPKTCSFGFVDHCGPEFGCIHWEAKG